MIRPLAVLFLLLFVFRDPALAGEPPAILAAEHEAIAFLIPCDFPHGDLRGLCLQNQKNFVEEYVRGLSGERMSIIGLPMAFSVLDRMPPADRLFYVGMPASQVQACAWATVSFLVRKPQAWERHFRDIYGRWPAVLSHAMMLDECRPLTPSELDQAHTRAEALLQRLTSAPLALPSPDWTMPWVDIRAFEGQP